MLLLPRILGLPAVLTNSGLPILLVALEQLQLQFICQQPPVHRGIEEVALVRHLRHDLDSLFHGAAREHLLERSRPVLGEC